VCINYTTQFCAALPAESIGKQFFTRKIYKKSNSAIFHGAFRRVCDNLISNKKYRPKTRFYVGNPFFSARKRIKGERKTGVTESRLF